MTVGDSKLISSADLKKGRNKLLNVTADDLDVILKQYGITPKVLDEMILSIIEWYKKQPHLPQGQLSHEVITHHLITRGFSVERVKEKLDNYFTVRHRMPEILCERDPLDPTLNKYLRRGSWVVLPKKTPSNNRITILRLKTEDTNVSELMKLAYMMSDYRLWNDFSIGDEYIIDLENASIPQMMQMTPMMISNILYYSTECFGPKIKGIHLVNVPPFAVTIISLFKKAMKSKLVQRMYFYESYQNIMKIIPKDIMPRDLGGNEISCQDIAEKWIDIFETNPWRQYFVEQNNIRSDESKRESSKNRDEMYGIKGSFRKLDLD